MSWPASVALGVSLPEGAASRSEEAHLAALDAWAALHGRQPASTSIWVNWAQLPWAGGPRWTMPSLEFLQALDERGVCPVIFWQPVIGPTDAVPFADIVAGIWDPYIDACAAELAAFGHRVIVRFAHEGNAPWFPWAIGKAGNTKANCRNAHRRVHDRVRAIAPKVDLLWCPNAHQPSYVPIPDLYPGDAYCQFVGFDSYQWNGSSGKSPVQLWRPTIEILKGVTSTRPIIVGETAVAGGGDQPWRKAWVRDGLREAQETWPVLAAILWLDIDMTSGGHRDWRIRATPSVAQPWRNLLADPAFQGTLRRT